MINKQTDALEQHGQNNIMTHHNPPAQRKGRRDLELHVHLNGVPDFNRSALLKAGPLPEVMHL